MQQPSRRDTRPIGQNGKRLTDRQIARQLRATARKGRATPLAAAQRPRPAKPRLGERFLSLGAMLFAGALLVGMSVPANAFITQTIAARRRRPADQRPARAVLEVDDDVAAISTSRDAFT